MPYGIHRDGDSRQCGATTISSASSTYINGKLVALDDDPNSHGGGELIADGGQKVTIENKKVIMHKPDKAHPDSLDHPLPPTDTDEGSGNTFTG